jgi:uncharacterized cupredoxin-like copper-binding protein
MPNGLLGINDIELVVSDADPFFADQYIRIEGERLQVTAIPSTGQRIVEEIGRTAREFMVSGAAGIDVGAVVRIDGELMEVTAVRDEGDPSIALDGDVTATATRISVSDPSFFGEGYVFGVGEELIEVVGPVESGQVLAETVGRAETIISVSGTQGLESGVVVRMEQELLRVTEIVEPARLEVERAADGAPPVSHAVGTAILRLTTGDAAAEAAGESPNTGESVLEPVVSTDASIAVSGIAGIIVGETYQLDNEVVIVTDSQPARLRVQRGVGGTSRAEHPRRAEVFQGNLLDVERGVQGSQASAHSAGDELFLATIEVKRAVAGSGREIHAKDAEINLGNGLIVERGVLNTEPAEHANGVLIRDFPPAPEDSALTGETCGQIPVPTPVPIPTPTPGPSPTPPEGAEVALSLAEFSILPEPVSVVGGFVNFQVRNDGVILHDFRVIASDLAVDALPMDASGLQVDEAQVDVAGTSQLLEAGANELVSVEMPAGNYILICNVATHYQAGMRTSFEVTVP